MASSKSNIVFEKTSFLQGGNSTFIKDLYIKYLNDPNSIPLSWKQFFDGLDEDQETIKKEILGPSWAPSKNNTLKTHVVEKNLVEDNQTSIAQENYEIEKKFFFKYVKKIGYQTRFNKKKTFYEDKIVKAFQRRFRPAHISGKIDQECLLIAKNLSFLR